jgi:hypothetical protein
VVFKDSLLAVVGASIFSLLPHKLEVYHVPIYAYMDVANFFYIMALIAAVYYSESEKNFALVLSLLSYSIAILFYETGFFLPFVLMIYFYFWRREKFRASLYFFAPSSIYFFFRISRGFGMAEANPIHLHQPNLLMLPNNLIDLFHQYLGRSIVRIVAYGTYQFPFIESNWLFLIVLLNVTLLTFLGLWLKKRELDGVNGRTLILAGAMFGLFLLPSLLNSSGGVGGRQLVLPSLGVSIFIISLLEKTRRQWRVACLLLIACSLVISQGNAWAQVVACRINAAVYETLKERQVELKRAKRVIIDTKSFADKIPFTWVQRDFNVLNTYYGAQAFEDWGLKSMVTLATGGTGKPVYIATESPRVIGQGLLEFGALEYQGYRSVSKKVGAVPQEGTVVIDFKSVFGGEFRNGVRKIDQRAGS